MKNQRRRYDYRSSLRNRRNKRSSRRNRRNFFHEEPNIPEADDRLIEDLVKEHHENTEDTEEPSLTQTLNDEIKQQITTKMDIILSEKVRSKTDNFPAEKEADEVSRSLKPEKIPSNIILQG